MARIKNSGSKPENLEKYLKQYRELAEKLEHINYVLDRLKDFSSELKREIKLDVSDVESATLKALNYEDSEKNSQVGRPSKWGTFITHKLKTTDSPMTYQQIVSASAILFGLHTKKDMENASKVVFSTVHRLKSWNQLDTYGIQGQREKFVVLKSWCTETGKLKKQYREKMVPKEGNAVGKKIMNDLLNKSSNESEDKLNNENLNPQ